MIDDAFNLSLGDALGNDGDWFFMVSELVDQLERVEPEHLELWPADDFVAKKRYIPCPRRGTHRKITECWACWCDVAWGYATTAEVLGPGDTGKP